MKQEIKNRIEQINNGIVPEGYEKTDFGIFPCDNNWGYFTIGDCSNGKGDYGLNAPACDYSNKLPKYIRITDIDDNGNYIDNGAYVNDKDSEHYILKNNDIVFARTGASVGKSYLYNKKDGELAYAGFLIRFQIDSKKIVPYLLKANCNTVRYNKWVAIMSARSGQPGINSEEYAQYSFMAPKLAKEQSKIAEILMKWDDAIDLQQQYIQKLEERKKVLLKTLFTKKCTWIQMKMNDMGDLYQPITISESELSEEGYLVYGANGIIGKYNKFNHEQSEIAITCRGSTCGTVVLTEPKSWITGNAMVFKIKDGFCKRFLYYACVNRGFVDVISGSGQPQITRSGFAKIIFSIPSEIKEQEKIANILSKADEEISLQKEKLEQLKKQRKAMQQYLLTGIVRV